MAQENSLVNATRRGNEKAPLAGALAKLPALAVPRPHGSAAGILPLWDLFHDDASGLGIMVLKDGTYRCCFEIDGVHVSGFDEVRLVSLMNHFTGFLNGIDTSVQMTIACHSILKNIQWNALMMSFCAMSVELWKTTRLRFCLAISSRNCAST